MVGPQTRPNLSFASKNKLTRNTSKAPTKGSRTPTPTFAVSHALKFTLFQALAPALSPLSRYTNENLQRAT